MLEIIQNQFNKGLVITKNRYYSPLRRDRWPNYHWELYPMAEDYYHELNPFFLYKMVSPELYKYYDMFTVRDGMVTFANFILNNMANFSKLGPKLFLIPPKLAPIVPPNLTNYFGTWSIVRPEPLKMSEAKKILIAGYISDQALGNIDKIPNRLKVLKNLREDVEIELYIPIRRNILDPAHKESITPYIVANYITQAFPNKKLHFLTTEDVMAASHFKDTYVFDLSPDPFYVSDNFLHYNIHSKGGTIHGVEAQAPKDSIFNIALSFHHELHVQPFPQVDSVFTELLFYKKQTQGKDYVMDPVFHRILRDNLKIGI